MIQLNQKGLVFSIIAAAFATGCITGNYDYRKSSLKDLSPDAPQQSAAVSGFAPYVKLDRAKYITVVSGRVWVGRGIERVPLRGALIQVIKDDQVLMETRSDSGGAFKMRGSLLEMIYQIKATSGSRVQVKQLAADSFLLDGIEIDTL